MRVRSFSMPRAVRSPGSRAASTRQWPTCPDCRMSSARSARSPLPTPRRFPRTAPSPTARRRGTSFRPRWTRAYLHELDAAVAPARAAGLQVEYGAGAGQIGQTTDDKASEIIGLSCALLLLLFMFGSVVAAALPLVSAVFSVLSGLSLVGLLAAGLTFPTAAPTVATLLGLGVAVDYGLFLVARHREQSTMAWRSSIGWPLGRHVRSRDRRRRQHRGGRDPRPLRLGRAVRRRDGPGLGDRRRGDDAGRPDTDAGVHGCRRRERPPIRDRVADRRPRKTTGDAASGPSRLPPGPQPATRHTSTAPSPGGAARSATCRGPGRSPAPLRAAPARVPAVSRCGSASSTPAPTRPRRASAAPTT